MANNRLYSRKPDDADKLAALIFIKAHVGSPPSRLFQAGEMLEAFRRTHMPSAKRDWSNTWTGVIKRAVKERLIRRVSVSGPWAKGSHDKHAIVYRSLLLPPPLGYRPENGWDSKRQELAMLWNTRKVTSINELIDRAMYAGAQLTLREPKE